MEHAPKTRFKYYKPAITASMAVVLLIVSIWAIVSRSASTQLPEAIELISSKMLLTRQKAIASQTQHRIQYDYLKSEFRIYREMSPGRYELDPPDNCYALPQGVTLSPPSRPVSGLIEIEPDGAIKDGESPVVLKLSDQNRRKKSVRITRAGMVQELPTW